MAKADICPRTDAIDLGTYKTWKKHDGLPLVKNEKVDISVVLDDNRVENYNWEFDLNIVNNYNDKKCFMLKSDKNPAEIGSDKFKKKFAKRIITVELKNTNFDIEVLNIRNGLKHISLKNNIINVKAVIENVNKLVLHKVDKIPGTCVEEEHASQVLDRNNWVDKMGKLRFRILGRKPTISKEHIKMHKVFIDENKFCTFDGDVIEKTDAIPQKSCSDYGLNWRCKYDDPKKQKGWHCDLTTSNDKDLAKKVVKDLQVEFVLSKTYSDLSASENSKVKTNLLKRKLFKEKIKEESPLLLFCTLFLFVFSFLFAYFTFLFYIGDVGNRPKLFTSVKRTKMSPIRRFFFPIYMSELTKVLPLCFLMVCTVFVYSTYRDIKDSMVVGAADEFHLKAGNVMTNWLKMFGVLPCALIFMAVLMNLTQRYRFPTVFYCITAFFGFYFVLNALVLYPNRKMLTVMPIVNWMKELDPDSMLSTFGGGAAGIFAFPVTSLHYIMSELWGTVTLSFLAWGYTNIITKREDASRWYPQVALLAQIGQIIAGSSVGELATSYKENYNKCLLYLNCLTAVLTFLFGLTCFWLDKFVMEMPRFKLSNEVSVVKKKKRESWTIRWNKIRH
jgi:AAA family ATP:ADP antiporter